MASMSASPMWSTIIVEASQLLQTIWRRMTDRPHPLDDRVKGSHFQRPTIYRDKLHVNFVAAHIAANKILLTTHEGEVQIFAILTSNRLQILASLNLVAPVIELEPPIVVEQLVHNGAVFHTGGLVLVPYKAHSQLQAILDYVFPHRQLVRARSKANSISNAEHQGAAKLKEEHAIEPVVSCEAVHAVPPENEEELPQYIIQAECDLIVVPAIKPAPVALEPAHAVQSTEEWSNPWLAKNLEHEGQVEKLSLALEKASYQLIDRLSARFAHQARQRSEEVPEHLKDLINQSEWHQDAHFVNRDIYAQLDFAEYVRSGRHAAPDYDSKELAIPLDPERKVCWLKFASTVGYEDVVTVIPVRFGAGSSKEYEVWIEGPAFCAAWMTMEQAEGVDVKQSFLSPGQECHDVGICIDGETRLLASNLPIRLASTWKQQPYDPLADEKHWGLSAFRQEEHCARPKPKLVEWLRKVQGFTVEEWEQREHDPAGSTRAANNDARYVWESESGQGRLSSRYDDASRTQPNQSWTNAEPHDEGESLLDARTEAKSLGPDQLEENGDSLAALTRPDHRRESRHPVSLPYLRKYSDGSGRIICEADGSTSHAGSAADARSSGGYTDLVSAYDGEESVCSYETDPGLSYEENLARKSAHKLQWLYAEVDKLEAGVDGREVEVTGEPKVATEELEADVDALVDLEGDNSGEKPFKVDFSGPTRDEGDGEGEPKEDVDCSDSEDEDSDEDEFDRCSYVTDPNLTVAQNNQRRSEYRIEKLLRGGDEKEAEFERWQKDPNHPLVIWDLRDPRYQPIERPADSDGEIAWIQAADFALQKEAHNEAMERCFFAPLVELRFGGGCGWDELCAELDGAQEEERRRVEDGSVEQEAAILDCCEPQLPEGVMDCPGLLAWLREAETAG